MQRRDLRTQWGKESGVSRDSSTVPTAAREGSQPVGAAAPHREPSLLLGGGLGGWGEGVSLREQGQMHTHGWVPALHSRNEHYKAVASQ